MLVVHCVMRDGTEDDADVLSDEAPAWFLRKKVLPFPDGGIIDVVFRPRAPGSLVYEETTEDPVAVEAQAFGRPRGQERLSPTGE